MSYIILGCIFLVSVIIYDQLNYKWKKRDLVGRKYKIPIVGDFFNKSEKTLKNYVDMWNKGVMTCNMILHKFIIIPRETKTVRDVFARYRDFKPTGPVIMDKVLGADNFVFSQGEIHLKFCRFLKQLLNNDAIQKYTNIQQKIYDKYLNLWSMSNKPLIMTDMIKNMAIEATIAVLCGKEDLDKKSISELSEDFFILVKSFDLVNLPLNIPGTNLYKSIQARNRILNKLRVYINDAKNDIDNITSSTSSHIGVDKYKSLIHDWIILENNDFTDKEIEYTLLTLILASQDASASSLVWTLQILADNQNVVDDLKIYGDNFLHSVVKEILRYRPPITMMPYEATHDTKLDNIPIDKGTIVIGSIYPPLQDSNVYSEPDVFKPDRFISPTVDQNNSYLVFGHGTHICIGRYLAQLSLANFIKVILKNYHLHHHITENSQIVDIVTGATYPRDGCILTITKNTKN